MKISILGAHGKIAQIVEARLTKEVPNLEQTLFLRHASRMEHSAKTQTTVIEGSADNPTDLEKVLPGSDIVYANLAGDTIETQAKVVTTAMKQAGVKRLIWISTLGIYDEVPGNYGKWNHQMLDGGYLETYAAAAKIVEESGLDYTIIRPAWLSNKEEIDYELTEKGSPFKGTEVSRASVADLIVNLISDPALHIGSSLGVDKPGTAGDKPEWYR